MKFKAVVTNKETKERKIIEADCKSKKQFLEDLRNNGYSVSDRKVKKAEVWNWIINETNCQEEDWYFNTIPESDEEYLKKVQEYRKRVETNKYMRKWQRPISHNA